MFEESFFLFPPLSPFSPLSKDVSELFASGDSNESGSGVGVIFAGTSISFSHNILESNDFINSKVIVG